jgi:hypothetical protein
MVGVLPGRRTDAAFFFGLKMSVSHAYFQGLTRIGRTTHKNVDVSFSADEPIKLSPISIFSVPARLPRWVEPV